MKISIENLGPLTHAEFDLKPLTVFIGDNRQGKTQALTIGTAMLDRNCGATKYLQEFARNPNFNLPDVENIYGELIQNDKVSLNIITYITQNTQIYLNNLASLAPDCINEILGTKRADPHSLRLSYILESHDLTHGRSWLEQTEISVKHPGLGINVVKERGVPDLFIYKTEKYSPQVPDSEIKNLLTSVLVASIHQSLVQGVIYYPSERTGISLILQMLTNQNLKTLEKISARHDNREQEKLNASVSAKIPYPTQNFLEVIASLVFGPIEEMEKIRRRTAPKSTDYVDYANLLITKIIGENIYLSDAVPNLTKEILIDANGTTIDLSAASSGVKGLMGLVLYLRHLATPGNLIVIDEPEQNLHPNQQAAFAEFLALLVNNGIRVAITTHSPYIVEHLQNLILAHDLNDRSEIVDSLYLKREDSFISKDNVGVYLFHNGTTENILMDDGEINWQTFCDTANIIGNISSLVYDKKYEESDRLKKTAEMSVAEEEPAYQR